MHPDSYFPSSYGLDFFCLKMGNVPECEAAAVVTLALNPGGQSIWRVKMSLFLENIAQMLAPRQGTAKCDGRSQRRRDRHRQPPAIGGYWGH